MLMSLVWIVAAILIAGVIVWAVDNLPGIDESFRKVAKVAIIAVLVIFAIVTLVGLFGAGVHWR